MRSVSPRVELGLPRYGAIDHTEYSWFVQQDELGVWSSSIVFSPESKHENDMEPAEQRATDDPEPGEPAVELD
jgi:hypothetical protein